METKSCILTPYIKDVLSKNKKGQEIVFNYIWFCGRLYDDIKENHFYKKYLEPFDTAPLYRIGNVRFPDCLRHPEEQDFFLRLVISCISIYEYYIWKEGSELTLFIIPIEDGPAFRMHELTPTRVKGLFWIILSELMSIATLDAQFSDAEPKDVLEERRNFFRANVKDLEIEWSVAHSQKNTE